MKAWRILALLLAVVLCVPMLAVHAEKPVIIFQKKDFTKIDQTLEAGNIYKVQEGGTYRVEKGAVLTVRGELIVEGTLKNYGTIVIVESNSKKREDPGYEPGSMSIQGELQNYGKIVVRNATIVNLPRGIIRNEGDILLTNDNPDLTLLWNRFQDTGAAQPFVAEIYNGKKGTIRIAAEAGVGIRSQKGALLDNKGKIMITENTKSYGEVTGNPVVYFVLEK